MRGGVAVSKIANAKIGMAITALALMLSIFVLCVLNGSTAWFADNKEVSVNGMTVSADYIDVNATYTVYMSDIDGKGTDKDVDGNLLNITNIVLNPYDAIFTERNEITPVCIKITLGGSDLPESGSAKIKIRRTVNNDEQSAELTPYVSSILSFSSGISAELDKYTGADEIYAAANEAFKSNMTDSSMFVLKSEDIYPKVETISLDLEYTASDISKDVDGNNILNLYVYIEYDEELSNEFSNNNGDALDAGLDGLEQYIKNDLKDISIEIR